MDEPIRIHGWYNSISGCAWLLTFVISNPLNIIYFASRVSKAITWCSGDQLINLELHLRMLISTMYTVHAFRSTCA
jgi:hypothetical protein